MIGSTATITSAFLLNDGDGRGYANFGVYEDGLYRMSYCYYHHYDSRHYAIAYLDGHNNGKVTAYAGQTASSNSPSHIGGRDTRNYDVY